MVVVTFLQEVIEELKKVTWPTQQEIVRLTIIVIAISVLVGLYIGGLDFILVKITELLIK